MIIYYTHGLFGQKGTMGVAVSKSNRSFLRGQYVRWAPTAPKKSIVRVCSYTSCISYNIYTTLESRVCTFHPFHFSPMCSIQLWYVWYVVLFFFAFFFFFALYSVCARVWTPSFVIPRLVQNQCSTLTLYLSFFLFFNALPTPIAFLSFSFFFYSLSVC